MKKLMFYPMIFMFFYALLFFLPSRNISKEFVLYDENTGKVYVLDRDSYEEMKNKNFRNSNAKQQPFNSHPSQNPLV